MPKYIAVVFGLILVVASGNAGMNGACGNGVCDDTSAAQSLLTYAKTTGGVALCTPGLYKITSTLTVSDTLGFSMTGSFGCTFAWAGNSTTPMFLFSDVANASVSGFRVTASTAFQLAEAFRIENGPLSNTSPTQNSFRDIMIEGTNGGVNYGFRGRIGAGGDNDTDFMFFDHVRVVNYAIAAWSIEGGQMHGWHMINCRGVAAGGIGKYAVSGGSSTGAQSNFTWDGGFTGANVVADFFITTPTSQSLGTSISNLSSEGSSRLLLTDGPSGAYSRVTLSDIRFATNGIDADGYALKLLTPGPYIVRNCGLGEDYSKTVKILWTFSPGYSRPAFLFEGSTVTGSLSLPSDVFIGTAPTSTTGSSLQTGDQITTPL